MSTLYCHIPTVRIYRARNQNKDWRKTGYFSITLNDSLGEFVISLLRILVWFPRATNISSFPKGMFMVVLCSYLGLYIEFDQWTKK